MAIDHNAKAFDLMFVLNRVLHMKGLLEILIMIGQKIMSGFAEVHMFGYS